jgi:hypothetical protein
MSDAQRTLVSLSQEERLAVERLVKETLEEQHEEEAERGEQAVCTSGALVLGSKGQPMEIVCGVCGVRSIGADTDAACRAYALHMYTAHTRTVSYSDGRALARPLDRRVLAARRP